MKSFCQNHGRPVELEDGYPVLPCVLYNKVCGFRLAGAVEFCPDVKLLPFEFDGLKEYIGCEGGQCKL